MHRFHLPADHWESATLPADESHHCVNVLRLEAGERISVFDGAGREASGTIVEARAKGVVLKISGTAKTPPPPCAIVLVQAVPKGKNMDLIVQKAVELGASQIAPILSDRTVVQLEAAELAKKREKWQAVALEACKQCGQNHLPKVGNPASPKDFLEHSDRNELMLIASLQPDARPLKAILAEFQAVHSHLPRSVTVLVGPEGDFTPAELALAKTNGCIPMTLGPIILRTETAAIYCLSVLAHELFQPASR
jgi:16S rRNA (uracil1498-N3)-methyltransferase